MQVMSGMRGAAAVIVVLASVGAGALSQAGPAAAASATSAGPGGTWGQPLAIPGASTLTNGSNQAATTAISCTSPGECAAVGSYDLYSSTTHAYTTWPLVVSRSGGAWGQAEALPGIAALSSGLGGELTEVSCASAGNCSAAGTDDHSNYPLITPFLADEVDGTWEMVQAVPDAASLGQGISTINAISCPSAGDCAAVGSGSGSPFILDEVNGTWGDPLAVPGLASLGTVANTGFDSVSCAAAGDCTAIGTVKNASGVQSAVVVTESNGTWNDATALPGLSALSPLGSSGGSVSCPAAGDCTATGSYELAGNSLLVWVAGEVNGSWGSVQALTTLGATWAGRVKLSCATPGNCAVTGDYVGAMNRDHAFVADEVNGTWQASQDIPGLAGIEESYAGAISCPAPGDCAATGIAYYDPPDFKVYATDEVNGVWGTATALPGAASENANVTAMSCTAPGYCSATVDMDGLSLVSEATDTAPTLTVAANDSPGDDQAVPVTVSVTSPAGGTPTGTVTVTAPLLAPTEVLTAPACTATLSGGTGTCAFPTTGLPGGTYQLTAAYSGDTTYAASTSAATAALTVTSFGLWGPSKVIVGQPITIDGKLWPASGGSDNPPAGAVISITRTLAGSTSSVESTVTTDADGDAGFTITDTPPAAGTYTYTTSYTSDQPNIVSSTGSFTVTVAARTYSGTIRLPKMGLCLDDRNNSATNGAVVQVWKCTGSANQSWQVYSDGTIRHNGLCLDASGYGTTNGTKVQLWACTGAANQQWDTRGWRVHYDDLAASNEVLDDTGFGGNGTQQQIWTNLGGTNQYWATS